jgi:predicted metal-dependent hydrolase
VTLRTETRRLVFGSTVIEYTLRRSIRRRKTVEIAIDPVNGVLVSAPASATNLEVDNIMRRRAPRIVRRLAAAENGADTAPRREWVTGETILYLGHQYRLRFVDGDRSTRWKVRLTGRWLEIRAPDLSDETLKRKEVIRAVEQWYRQRAERKLRERVDVFASRFGVRPKGVLVRSQTKRWASCSPDGTLRFNWRIIMAPLSVVDYVVAHELCHLRHANHDRRFWQSVAVVMPDYPARRETLRRNGFRYWLA